MVEPHSTHSALRAIEIFQGLGETGLGEEMIQPRGQLGAKPEMFGTEFFRDLLQSFEMSGRITIPKRMVGDEFEATLEEGAQWIKGCHAYMLLWRK